MYSKVLHISVICILLSLTASEVCAQEFSSPVERFAEMSEDDITKTETEALFREIDKLYEVEGVSRKERYATIASFPILFANDSDFTEVELLKCVSKNHGYSMGEEEVDKFNIMVNVCMASLLKDE